MYLRSEIDKARERWELIPGTAFDKTLTLLRCYAGLSLSDGEICEVERFTATKINVIDFLMAPSWKRLKGNCFNQIIIFLQGLSMEGSILFHFPKELYYVIALSLLDLYQKDRKDLYKEKIQIDLPTVTNLQNLGLFKMPQTDDVFYGQALFKRPVLCPSSMPIKEEENTSALQIKYT